MVLCRFLFFSSRESVEDDVFTTPGGTHIRDRDRAPNTQLHLPPSTYTLNHARTQTHTADSYDLRRTGCRFPPFLRRQGSKDDTAAAHFHAFPFPLEPRNRGRESTHAQSSGPVGMLTLFFFATPGAQRVRKSPKLAVVVHYRNAIFTQSRRR